MTRYILALCFTLMFAVSACDDDNSDTASTDPAVGSACATDAECPGPGVSQCITEGIYPLAALADSDNDKLELLDVASVGLNLPGGYCSTEPNCVDEDDCGVGGTCFFPLRDVESDFFDGLISLLELPEDEAAVMMTLVDFGQCLRACDDDGDCPREGYVCGTPLADFLAMVDGSDQSTFCIGEDDL
jgi:hypothetical protein